MWHLSRSTTGGGASGLGKGVMDDGVDTLSEKYGPQGTVEFARPT